MSRSKYLSTGVTMFLLPAVAFAAPATYSELVSDIIDLINLAIPLIIGIAFVFFLWKLIDAWVLHPDDENKRRAGKTYLVAAIISFVMMVIVWTVVSLIKGALFG